MTEPASSAVSAILLKLFPAAVGAALMIAVDTPKTRKEWFLRILVAFISSWAFYGFAFDFLQHLPWLSFMDKRNEDHQFAVRALLGASGWFVLGAASMWLKKFRGDPVGAVREAKRGAR